MQKKLFEKSFIVLLPFLFLYLLIVLLNSSDVLFGDEGRYLQFAENILHGFYSPPPPNINLWNGPGFPIYLLPFLALHIPHIAIKLFNAILYFSSLLLFHKTLRKFLDAKKSLLASVVFGLYYMPYKSLPHILSEVFVIFLITLVTYLSTEYFSGEEKRKNIFQTLRLAFVLAFLALTKVMFGQVYLLAGISFSFLFLFTKNIFYKRAAILLTWSLLVCLPYLFYTYSLTGKTFYWSNAGGMSLYWMSNPAKGEWGEWHNDSLISTTREQGATEKLKLNHQLENDAIHKFTGIERDEKFKEYAIRNIKENPGQFFVNWMANWSRMFFNYPAGYFSFRWSTIGNMIGNIPVLMMMIYSTLLTFRNRKKLPLALKFLLIIAGIYLLASSLLSAYDRMFYILIPVIGLWIAYSLYCLREKTSNDQKSK